MSCCCTPIPCIRVTSINISAKNATLVVASPIPASGRFNLVISKCTCINPCSTLPVVIANSPTGSSLAALAKCGNYLQLGQLACHVKRGFPLHFNATFNPTGTAICLDKLSCPISPVAAKTCCTAVTTTGSASEADTAAETLSVSDQLKSAFQK